MRSEQVPIYLPRPDIQVAETSLVYLLRQNSSTVIPCGIIIQKMTVPLHRERWHREHEKALWSPEGETLKGCWLTLSRRSNKSLTFAVLKANEHHLSCPMKLFSQALYSTYGLERHCAPMVHIDSMRVADAQWHLAPSSLQLTCWGPGKLRKILRESWDLRITKAASSRTSLYHGKGNGTVTPRPAKPQQVSSYDTAKLSKYISLCPREIVMFVQPCTQNMKPCLTAWPDGWE